jgi:hypothetical protein
MPHGFNDRTAIRFYALCPTEPAALTDPGFSTRRYEPIALILPPRRRVDQDL